MIGNSVIYLRAAHIIQNSQNDLAQSCCTLRASSRWAITGTPIQNKLSDFASIVAFLRVHPYSDQVSFNEEILQPWQSNSSLGFLRLRTLVRAITIARTKAVVHLPPRDDFIHHLDFASTERQIYEDAKRHTVAMLQNAASSSHAGTTVNALQRLNNLRLICSHGLLTQSYLTSQSIFHNMPSTSLEELAVEACVRNDNVEDLFDGSSSCVQCGCTIFHDLVGDSQVSRLDVAPAPGISPSDLCTECRPSATKCTLERLDHLSVDLDHPNSPMSMGSSPAPSVDREQDELLLSMPTKVKELVADLVSHALEEKRQVTFSLPNISID